MTICLKYKTLICEILRWKLILESLHPMPVGPTRTRRDVKMRFYTLVGVGFVISCLVAVPLSVGAGEPTEQLSATINAFVSILASTPVAELRAKGLPENARELIFVRFDFSEMTKRSLGSHWNSLSQAEQHEFVEAFTQRLLVFYGRTVRSSDGDKIQFKGEVQEGGEARVETKVVGGYGEELPIDYKLHDVDGQWKVYDVSIDHVSLVNNYRAQFERVIAKSSVKDLLRKVKDQAS
ncbi:MAG TPA: ABC transporter substrate-binding protein [Candidatus Binatia bacterium]|nr:ABC transporter substrate-binding protein [Candidatus Binatia bacterium]